MRNDSIIEIHRDLRLLVSTNDQGVAVQLSRRNAQELAVALCNYAGSPSGLMQSTMRETMGAKEIILADSSVKPG